MFWRIRLVFRRGGGIGFGFERYPDIKTVDREK